MRFFFIIFLLLDTFLSFGQEYAIRQFTVDDGLPSSHVYEVKQDKQGFYWVATDAGVVRYDGYSFQRLSQKHNPFNKDIWWTYQDSKDRIWGLSIGTRLSYFDKDSFHFKQLYFENGIHENTAFANLLEDPHGYYWLIGAGWLYKFKNEIYDSFQSSKRLGNEVGTSSPELHQSKNKTVYCVTKAPITVWRSNSGGSMEMVYQYKDRIFLSEYDSSLHPSLKKEKIFNDSSDTFIYRSYDTLYTVSEGNLKGYFHGEERNLGIFPAASQIQGKSTDRVFRLGNKYVFVHANGTFVTDLQFEHLPEFDFLAKYKINTIYEDHEQSLWVSTADQGLIYLVQDALATKNHSTKENLVSEIVAIEASSSGKIWIGFKNGNVCLYDDEQLKCFETKPLNNDEDNWLLGDFKIIRDYLVLKVGFSDLQVYPIVNNTFNPDNPTVIPGFVVMKNINKNQNNELLITDYYKCFKLTFAEKAFLNLSEVRTTKALSLVEDSDGSTFFSTRLGLYKITEQGDSIMLDKELLVKNFEFDSNGKIWMINEGRGAVRIINDSLHEVLPLENTLVRDLFFEGDTIVWAATNEGLVQLHFNTTTNKFEYKGKLTMANGLLTNDVTAIHTDKNNLYVGTSKGFVVVDKSKLSTAVSHHKVFLREVSSDGRDLGVKDSYNLAPDYNSLEFNYVYISPKSAGKVTYQYKLEGIDSDWKETKETKINYPFLPAGNYRFQVKANDLNGVPSAGNIHVDIRIQEYWWKTTWFTIAAISSVIILLIIVFIVRIRQIKKRQEERTEMNNRLAELKLNALQSQMNPHFVFNVLNGIQDSFVSGQVLEANKYLSDFSKLMRLFLESSDEKHISLEKEINLLTYYIELEVMRLDNKFEFSFQVDENIELDETYVPTMLLQPIIENAIIHGIRYKEGAGKLIIAFTETADEKLLVVIEDDGLGRKRSAEINKQRRKDHVSKAGGIVKERIEIINAGEDSLQMTYIDLESDNIAVGTRVELLMDLEINR